MQGSMDLKVLEKSNFLLNMKDEMGRKIGFLLSSSDNSHDDDDWLSASCDLSLENDFSLATPSHIRLSSEPS